MTPVDNCTACTAARANRWCGQYRHGCAGCTARLIAGSPAYAEAAKANTLTPAYRSALQDAFGAEWLEAHKLVRKWAEGGGT